MKIFIEYVIGASNWQWYRRWRGGHWEGTYIDYPVGSHMWFQMPHGRPRMGLERGTRSCEDWP